MNSYPKESFLEKPANYSGRGLFSSLLTLTSILWPPLSAFLLTSAAFITSDRFVFCLCVEKQAATLNFFFLDHKQTDK